MTHLSRKKSYSDHINWDATEAFDKTKENIYGLKNLRKIE